ncbi:Uu.00g143310.m01.CDS01 [Anthostomella pinea]|uniref:Uu.00g143310.m01.CDS01 n=1 Tax=Anthostomella pinea TaxID=933095 RepID=A0AAI8YLS8_9PEZI|nr:Uu.00g143310.m01.CDS01 [Anthostomella pinea]
MSELKGKPRPTKKVDRAYVPSSNLSAKYTPINKRLRPLRTYSKRASSTDAPEPEAKRRRIADTTAAGTKRTTNAKKPPPPALPPQTAQKGTLFAYFKKVAPPTSSSTLPSEPSSEAAEHELDNTITPPSSPPKLNVRRKKARRLTTRVVSRDIEEPDDENGDSEESEERAKELTDGEVSPSSSDGGIIIIMAETSPNSLDRVVDGRRTKRPEAVGKRGKETPEVPKAATVQTTLSLSLNDQGFTECRDCYMLYNPYHEKDVRHHARLHDALQKARLDGDDTVD